MPVWIATLLLIMRAPSRVPVPDGSIHVSANSQRVPVLPRSTSEAPSPPTQCWSQWNSWSASRHADASKQGTFDGAICSAVVASPGARRHATGLASAEERAR